MTSDENIIESVAPKEGAKIVDAKKEKTASISDPQKRASDVTIISQHQPPAK